MRIYTRRGDAGETGLLGGPRVSKATPRVDAYGEVDELNAVLGASLLSLADSSIRDRVASLQTDLFAIGAHLATAELPPGRKPPRLPALPVDRVAEFESWMDEADLELPELRTFILPGGSPGGAALHLARTVCRRAERRVVELAALETVDPIILSYLNRLSDLLFVLARLENWRAGLAESPWQPDPY